MQNSGLWVKVGLSLGQGNIESGAEIRKHLKHTAGQILHKALHIKNI